MTKESQIKRSIIDYLKWQKDCVVFPIPTMGMWDPPRKLYRTTAGSRGTPDLLVCFRGRFVGIEVKTLKGRLSKEQKEALQAIKDSGGEALVARSIEDVQKALYG